MSKRFVSLWFNYLTTDWLTIRQPALCNMPFVFFLPERGRMIVTAANAIAQAQGVTVEMALADAKAIVPGLQAFDENPGRATKLLKAIGEWCIRYTPVVATDLPDGLILDVSGCVHLWEGEQNYLKEIVHRLKSKGYNVRAAMADTVGTAWAVARFGKLAPIVASGEQAAALLPLPPAALRLEPAVIQRLHKLGFYRISSLMHIERSVLRRRFGEGLLLRLAQALGNEEEAVRPLQVIAPYQVRLPCLEAVRTATAIEIAILQLLKMLCERLQKESKGLRTAILKCYRTDGNIEHTEIGTNRASHHVQHLFKLFESKIASITPALGIELFTLEALKVEDVDPVQEALWMGEPSLEDSGVTELLDRLASRVGFGAIHRYLPVEHYWPERSVALAASVSEKAVISWRNDRPRPTLLLSRPEPIEVTSLLPDYPPMLFIYNGNIHQVKKADDAERIEREWWLDEGEHRDYYIVEDHTGRRYWLFRSGHYAGNQSGKWFLHGFFA